MTKLARFPLYILFFPWYTILFLYTQNDIKLSPSVIVSPLVASALVCLLLWSIFTQVFKKSTKAGLFVGVLLLIIFMYGPLHKLTYFSFNIGFLPVYWDWVYIPLSLLLLASSLIFLIKSKRHFPFLNKTFNIAGAILMLLVLVPLVFNDLKAKFDETPLEEEEFQISTPAFENHIKPDIYYIIPEDYGSPQTLKDYYGYDDSSFVSYLTSRGFYIADKSRSNYPYSTFMISSILNLGYLNPKTLPKINKESGGAVIDDALQNSKALQYLKAQGYTYFNIGSWYEPLRNNNLADVNFFYNNKLNLDEFSNTILRNTIFYPLILRYFGISGRQNQIANTNYQFQTLSDMPKQISPKFVFVDILSPHTPYLFDSNCNVVKPRRDKKIEGFTNQVGCVNKKLMAIIDGILKNSTTPPIIIVQTDEGPKDENNQALKYPNKTGVVGGFKNASLQTVLERVSILNAIYLPGNYPNRLYPSISPVNTLRVIFDQYFNANLPILPDKVYTFDDYDKLYRFNFNDVTSSLNQ